MTTCVEEAAGAAGQRGAPEPRQISALHRLWLLASGNTGQSRVAAALLLSLYNGRRFPFDVTSLRLLDSSQFADCLVALEVDRCASGEVHVLLGVGNEPFEQLADAGRHVDVQRLEQRCS